jgi:hypothetical protein
MHTTNSHGQAMAAAAAHMLESRILPHLADAARMLAIKGFSPEEAHVREAVCKLLVRSEAREIEGRIEFNNPPGRSNEVHWKYAVSSPHLQDQTTDGVLRDDDGPEPIREVIDAFVSVFTTAASFSGGEMR